MIVYIVYIYNNNNIIIEYIVSIYSSIFVYIRVYIVVVLRWVCYVCYVCLRIHATDKQ